MGFALAFLPWKILYGLRMNMKEKIGITVAMGMGVMYVTSFPDAFNYKGTAASVCTWTTNTES